MANPAHPRWRDWRKYVGENGGNYIDANKGSWCYAQAGHQPKLMPKGSGVPLEIRMHGRKGSERLLRRREEMIARGMPQAKANAATAAELVRWLWALGTMCREGAE